MEVLGWILTDWEACRPSDGSIPEDRLQEVMDRATARILDAPAPSQMQQDAYTLLEPEAGEAMGDGGRPPLLERMLLRGRAYAHGGSSPSSGAAPGGSGLAGDPGAGADAAGLAQIHFLRFWQAWQELLRRLGQPNGQGNDEPLAEELVIFRDTLLRHAASSEGLTGQKLASEAAAARAMSADQAAWLYLEEAAGRLSGNAQHAAAVASFASVTVAAATAAGSAASRGRQASPPPSPPLQHGGAIEAMGPAELCGVLLGWLHELAEDYSQGPRAAKARAVMDVCRCTRREACFQLGARSWDVEAAMMGYYGKACGGSSPLGGSAGSLMSWSSQGAKLRQNEVDCPICCEPYATGAKPVVSRCCFQVLCKSCHERLTQPAGVWPETAFQCPFCRNVERHASANLWQQTQQAVPQQPATGRSFSLGAIFGRNRRSSSGAIGGVLGTMGQAANEAARALEELAANFREDEGAPLTGAVPARASGGGGREGQRSSSGRATAPRTPAQPRGSSASTRQRIWAPG